MLISRHCSGGIILRFERCRADSGVLKLGTPAEKRVSAPLIFPSPWNHLESGILFGLRLPILVFREADISGDIFDNGVSDVFVHPIPSPDITGPAKSALKQVFQRCTGKVRLWGITSESFMVLSELADAKDLFDENPRCLDILVTQDGTKKGVVVGWITNVIVLQASYSG